MKNIKKISISVPTYNRFDTIEVLSTTLKSVINVEKHHIRVYDDASTEFTLNQLSVLFPTAKEVIQNEVNLGADGNLYQMMTDFLQCSDDILFICDSDLIVHPQCLLFIENNMQFTDGVMSLYNSANHPVSERLENDFVIKRSIGAAGSVYTRDMAEQIIHDIPQEFSNYWDWAMSFYLNSIAKKIYVSKNSYVQHIGIDGENNSIISLDYGINYHPETDFEKKLMAKFYEDFFIAYTSIAPYQAFKRHYRRKFMGLLKWLMIKLLGYKFTLRVLSFKKKQSDKKNK